MGQTTDTELQRHSERVDTMIGAGWHEQAHLRIAHMGWEMDNIYWCVRDAGGEIHWLGTDHGALREVHQQTLRQELVQAHLAAQEALDIFLAIED